MIPFPSIYICNAFEELNITIQSLLRTPDQNAPLHFGFSQPISRLALWQIIESNKNVFLDDDLHGRIWRLTTELQNGERFTSATLARELQGILSQMTNALAKRTFAYIEPPTDAYFEKDRLFGAEIYEQFPEARNDLKDAGNCVAASLPTAAVFHLMRVAEHGLRRLARKMRVSVTHKGKPKPIEFSDWNDLITAIQNKITTARQLSPGPTKQAKLEAFSFAADQCGYMKDIWRNNVSHSRNAYTPSEALAAFDRVRDFMRFLAVNKVC